MNQLWNKLVIAVAVVIFPNGVDSQKISPVVQMGTVEFYDQFEDEVQDMVYPGGYILIECLVQICQAHDTLVELIGPTGVVVSAACDTSVGLRLDVHESTRFGDYRCKYASEISEDYYDYKYRFCSPLDAACSESCRNDGTEYCLVMEYFEERTQSVPCITREEQEFSGKRFCYSQRNDQKTERSLGAVKYCGAEQLCKCDSPQPSTLCEAHSQRNLRVIKARVFDPNVTADCVLNGSQHLPLDKRPLAYPTLGGRDFAYRYNSILTDGEINYYYDLPRFSIPYHYTRHYVNEADHTSEEIHDLGVILNCTVKAAGGTIIWYHVLNASDVYYASFISAYFQDKALGFGLYKLTCRFIAGDGFLLSDISLYIIGGSVRASIKSNTTDDGRYTRMLTCEPESALPPRFVISKYEWYKSSRFGMEYITGENGPEHIPKLNGSYHCQLHIAARCRKRGAEEPDAKLNTLLSGGVNVTPLPKDAATPLVTTAVTSKQDCTVLNRSLTLTLSVFVILGQ